MSKRQFRDADIRHGPEYPTLDSVQSDRRGFLARLGGVVLGAGALGALAACDGRRPVNPKPDQGPLMGEPRMPDAGADTLPHYPDSGPPMAGSPRLPPAKRDQGTPSPDSEPPPMGDAPQPPARADASPAPPEMGYAPVPDAQVD